MDSQQRLQQPVFMEILKQQQERMRRRLPPNAAGGDDSMDRSTLEAYERYVLAQFKFTEPEDVEQERTDAISSLLPGTKHYYRLYFLNLAKQKKQLQDFTDDEAELYLKFDQKYGKDALFSEVETWLQLINPLEKLPNMSKDISNEDAKLYGDIV